MAKYYFTLTIFSCILLAVSSLTVDLFHRDSPRSPFHNISLSEYDRVNNAVKRSMNPKSSPTNGDQLMQISVGSPAKPFTVVVDTKKMYTWIQCEPCDQCYTQKDPIFKPSQSSTYKPVGCSTKTCLSVHERGCDTTRLVCTYDHFYGDGSQTRGDYATDTLVIGSATKSNMLFGCSHKSSNSGYFQNAAGVVGLGPGNNILNVNNNEYPNFSGKLSYCIAPSGASGKISFGTKVSGIGTVTTKLYHDSSYRVTLENIKVGDVTLAYPKKSVTLDTTSLVSKLPVVFFNQLRAELVKAINGTPQEDPSGLYQLCYGDDIKLPTLTVGFSGAELQVNPSNIFVKTSSDMKCFATFPSYDGSAYLGYLFQINFLIGFDSRRGQVSFKPTDCSKL